MSQNNSAEPREEPNSHAQHHRAAQQEKARFATMCFIITSLPSSLSLSHHSSFLPSLPLNPITLSPFPVEIHLWFIHIFLKKWWLLLLISSCHIILQNYIQTFLLYPILPLALASNTDLKKRRSFFMFISVSVQLITTRNNHRLLLKFCMNMSSSVSDVYHALIWHLALVKCFSWLGKLFPVQQ